MFGANGQDAGSAGLNSFGLLFFNNGDLQLKIHNVSNPNNGNGMNAPPGSRWRVPRLIGRLSP